MRLSNSSVPEARNAAQPVPKAQSPAAGREAQEQTAHECAVPLNQHALRGAALDAPAGMAGAGTAPGLSPARPELSSLTMPQPRVSVNPVECLVRAVNWLASEASSSPASLSSASPLVTESSGLSLAAQAAVAAVAGGIKFAIKSEIEEAKAEADFAKKNGVVRELDSIISGGAVSPGSVDAIEQAMHSVSIPPDIRAKLTAALDAIRKKVKAQTPREAAV